MKKNILIFSVISLVTCEAIAQRQDPVRVRSLAEKAAQGDVILGQENKKKQLSAEPPILNAADSFQRKESHSKANSKHKS